MCACFENEKFSRTYLRHSRPVLPDVPQTCICGITHSKNVEYIFGVFSGNPATTDEKYQSISFMPWRVFYYFGDVAVVIITNSNITINIITNIINILRNNDNRELIKFAVVFVTQKMPD